MIEHVSLPGDEPALVLLHEGLGSLRLWRSFPSDLHELTGLRTDVYSRHGHGDSDPPPRRRTPSFMHEEALEILPRLLEEWGVERPVLVGHSDGASIALIHAARFPAAAVVAMAPHVFVEKVCLAEIRRVKDVYEQEGLRERMAGHHRDPDAAFYGWNSVWLHPEFADWNIEEYLPDIDAPVLLIQGVDDQYGTMEQLDRIERAVTGPLERVHVDAGHAPHLEAPQATLAAVARFLAGRSFSSS